MTNAEPDLAFEKRVEEGRRRYFTSILSGESFPEFSGHDFNQNVKKLKKSIDTLLDEANKLALESFNHKKEGIEDDIYADKLRIKVNEVIPSDIDPAAKAVLYDIAEHHYAHILNEHIQNRKDISNSTGLD